MRAKDGGQDRNRQDSQDKAQGQGNGKVKPRGTQHFHSDEDQDHGQPDIEVTEDFNQPGNGKVEGAQAKNREGIGGQHNERVPGDGENGGDGIDGEHQIGGADRQQDQHQGCADPAILLSHPKPRTVILLGQWQESTSQTDEKIFFRLHLVVPAPPQKFPTSEDKDATEKENQPLEAIEEGDAAENKNCPKQKSPDDAPEKGGELGAFRHGKVAEQDGEDENVVDAQGKFHRIPGKEFHRGVWSKSKSNQSPEGGGENNPTDRGTQGSAKIHWTGVTVEKNQICGEEGKNQRTEGEPTVMKAGLHPSTFTPRLPVGKEDRVRA